MWAVKIKFFRCLGFKKNQVCDYLGVYSLICNTISNLDFFQNYIRNLKLIVSFSMILTTRLNNNNNNKMFKLNTKQKKLNSRKKSLVIL